MWLAKTFVSGQIPWEAHRSLTREGPWDLTYGIKEKEAGLSRGKNKGGCNSGQMTTLANPMGLLELEHSLRVIPSRSEKGQTFGPQESITHWERGIAGSHGSFQLRQALNSLTVHPQHQLLKYWNALAMSSITSHRAVAGAIPAFWVSKNYWIL